MYIGFLMINEKKEEPTKFGCGLTLTFKLVIVKERPLLSLFLK